MNRMRPVYTRQQSNPGTPGTPVSPGRSPVQHHQRAGSIGTMKKAQTKAAAQRLAQVMAHQYADDDVDEDDLSYEPAGTSGGIGLASGRSIRPRSPMTVRPYQDIPQSVRSGSGVRSSLSAKPAEQQPLSARGRASDFSVVEPSLPPIRPNISVRSSQAINMEQPPSARSSLSSRPYSGVKPVPVMPSSVPISLKPAPSSLPPDSPIENRLAERRLSSDWESMSFRDNSSQRSQSALQDEYDMLQEENDHLLEKLRFAEEKCDEAEARAKQLEMQISALGEGVTLESRLIIRKEAALQQREAALRMASQSRGGRHDEIAALRMEAETAKEKLYEVQVMTQLSKEEMDEVVMKRCWVARHWSLCLHHGIHTEIAEAKQDYWSSFTPSPSDVVLAAGQKAKEEDSFRYENLPKGENSLLDIPGHDEAIDIESMLLVEKGLRELASLKVEDGILLAMALQRRRGILKPSDPADEVKLRMEGQTDVIELNKEESEDFLFKQAWLMYFWRRAKNHEIEADIADERLQFWINQSTRDTNTLHDAVDVERGLAELRKLGIDNQLWQETRRGGSAVKTGNEF